MPTLDQIRRELKQVRYYYSRRKLLDDAFRDIARNVGIDTVDKYNKTIVTAPLRLYDLYINLYVNNHTQESLSEAWGYTPAHIGQIHKKLLLFFAK